MPETDKDTATARAQLVRVFEASAKIEFPTRDELNFRLAIMKALGTAFDLRAMRNVVIDGPATADTPRPGRGAKG